MKKIQVPLRDGQSISTRVIGQGKPVVLVHGFGSQSSHWLPNVLPLAHRFRFYLPDLRGFGNSHLTDFSHKSVFDTYADDLDDLMNHFQLDDVALGGISTGAYTCLAYNKQHGFERVNRYLNIEHSAQSKNVDGLSHGLFNERQDKIFSNFQSLLNIADTLPSDTPYWDLPDAVRQQFRDTVQALFQRASNRPSTRLLVGLAARFAEPLLTRHLIRVENWRVYLHIMQAFMEGYDTSENLAQIDVPTTLMMGRHSRYFSNEGQLVLKQHIPQAEVVIFEHSGHIPIVDEPLKFQREFARFLTR